MIIGIDPGPLHTAYAIIDRAYTITDAGKVENPEMIAFLAGLSAEVHVTIESIQSYGMAVGREVFETCYMIGRLQEAARATGKVFSLYPRPEYTRRLCGVQKVNDAILRQALLLRFGGDRKGEPLHLLKGCTDKRSAFAVAVYHLDITNHGRGSR